MKRVLAVILTLCLLLGAFPSFAEVDYASRLRGCAETGLQ